MADADHEIHTRTFVFLLASDEGMPNNEGAGTCAGSMLDDEADEEDSGCNNYSLYSSQTFWPQ